MFISGLLTSIAVELIIALIGYLFIKAKNSSLLQKISASKLFSHGIEYVYDNQKVAAEDIQRDMDNSKCIKIFTYRGRSFVHEFERDEKLSSVLNERKKERDKILSRRS
jgi:hypothetical protein